MFTQRPFSITYLGFDSTFDFLVNIGNVNPFILKYPYYNGYIQSLNTFFGAVYDENLEPVEDFNVNGQFTKLKEYISPIQKTVSLAASGSIYLKIPKIPIGSGINSGWYRHNWFCSRLDFDNVSNFLMWFNEFQIVTSIESNDLSFVQKNDPLEKSLINYPIGPIERVGYVYIKLADISIDGSRVTIREYFNSNIYVPSRYVTIGTNINRGLKIYFVGKTNIGDSYEITVGEYSRPNWTIMTRDEIFSVCKQEIEQDFLSFYSSWDSHPGQGDQAESLEILQIIAVCKRTGNGKILAKKVYEDLSVPEITEFTYDSLPLFFPALNANNTEIE
jgi:hypothetical protein